MVLNDTLGFMRKYESTLIWVKGSINQHFSVSINQNCRIQVNDCQDLGHAIALAL